MKSRVTRDRKSGSRTLVVRPTGREELAYDTAEWLRLQAGEDFVDFRYTRDGSTALYYDVTDLVDLPSYLKAQVSLDQYRRILVGLHAVLAVCTREGIPTSMLRLAPDEVLLTAEGEPRFTLVPLTGVPEHAGSSPLALLHHLASRRVKFVVPEDERHAVALGDFASRNKVLTISAFREFLASDLGISLRGDSGSLGGSLDQGVPARGPRVAGADAPRAFPVAPAAFDPVAMTRHAPSASQVVAGQTVAGRVCDAVGGVSPTACGRRRATGETRAEREPACGAGVAASAPAPVPAAPAGGTTLLGGPSSLRGGSVTGPDSVGALVAASLVRESDGELYALPMREGAISVGRSTTNDVRIDGDSNVSRRHLEVSRVRGAYELVDVGSSNGTVVRGRRLAPGVGACVAAGEPFLIAGERFRIVEE